MEDMKVFYLCDGRACDGCSNPSGRKDGCRFTDDIRHAVNFLSSGVKGRFFENVDGSFVVTEKDKQLIDPRHAEAPTDEMQTRYAGRVPVLTKLWKKRKGERAE